MPLKQEDYYLNYYNPDGEGIFILLLSGRRESLAYNIVCGIFFTFIVSSVVHKCLNCQL